MKKTKWLFVLFILVCVLCGMIFKYRYRYIKLNPDEIVEFIIVSPPRKKMVTREKDIQEFADLFNSIKRKNDFSVGNSSGWSKRVFISTKTYKYDIIFSGKTIRINDIKYELEESLDSKLQEYYDSLEDLETNYS